MNSMFSNPFNLIKFAVSGLVCVVIILYAWFQISSGISSGVETQVAVMTELYQTIETQGYIFRDEAVVNKTSGGTVVTIVSDGQRISKGEKLAAIYHDDGGASLQDDINRLQRRIDVLDKSAVDSEYLVSDIEKIDSDILDTLNSIYKCVNTGDLSSAVNYGSDFLVKLNKHELIVSSEKDYKDERTMLVAEKKSLESKINAMSTAVYATSSGYFYGDVDGYESSFSPALLEDITISEFEQLTDSKPDTDSIARSAGKIVNDFVWFVACSVDSSELAGFEEGSYYKLSFPEASDKTIKMSLYRIVRENAMANSLLIFRSNINPENFNYQRAQKVEIVGDSIEGLQIPKQSLRVINGVKGVYILFGDVVHFRRTEIIGETENYYIVSDNKDDYYVFEDEDISELSSLKALSLYDNVIVAGKDLFDGKIIG